MKISVKVFVRSAQQTILAEMLGLMRVADDVRVFSNAIRQGGERDILCLLDPGQIDSGSGDRGHRILYREIEGAAGNVTIEMAHFSRSGRTIV